jgi:glycosyltransferase involved in cell wall biosynthesis
MRGGERCLEHFLALYPDAEIVTLIHVPGTTTAAIDCRVKQTSFLNRLPGVRNYYRILLPLFPLATSMLDLRGYDLVVSLSHAAVKNIKVPAGTPHYCYCFSPMRYIWDQAKEYVGALTSSLAYPILKLLRGWDTAGAERVTKFCAISDFVAARIRCYYKKKAAIVYPPTNTSWITPYSQESFRQGEAFLMAGALVQYKHPERIIQAFNEMQLPLWVVGSGPMETTLKKMAGPTIIFCGRIDDAHLAEKYRDCRALVFAGQEDFGLIPVECMAAGRPVIALNAGGVSESVIGVTPTEMHIDFTGKTGVLYEELNDPVESLKKGVTFFLKHEEKFQPRACIEQSKKFSPEVFFNAWRAFSSQLDGTVDRAMNG